MARALPVDTGRAPVSARGARTRAGLVQAAREVFERDGFLAARITDITAEAGVAAGSFYTYFTSKEDAFAAVMDEVQEEMLHPKLREITDGDDPLGVIESANRAYLAAYRRNAKLMALMEQVSHVDERFRRLRLRRVRAFEERNAAALRTLQDRGLADPALDARLAARAVSAMVSRVAYLRYVQGYGNESSETLVRTLTALWAGALGITTTSGRLAPRRPPNQDQRED
jgi:AcrR family transcriptional regulator